MPSYEKNKVYAEKYLGKMDEIKLRMPKESGLKEAIQAHAEAHGESVQGFILRAIQETMRNDKRPRSLALDGDAPRGWDD